MAERDISNLTPAMRQYMSFKDQYPDSVLLFRMGDFYETFFEDAQVCAKALGITLTSRNSKSDNPIPLAGIPYHALNNYLGKLVRAGHKVAICEQVEDPAQAKGVVKRDVVRLITPGTLTEDALLEEAKGNFLAALSLGGSENDRAPAGLAWVELSTGAFYAQTVERRFVADELARIRPAECLVSDDLDGANRKVVNELRDLAGCVVTGRPGWGFETRHGHEALKKHFGVATLEGFGFGKPDIALAAAGAILDYLTETQKVALDHIGTLRKVSRETFLQLDQTTLRSLEVERTIRDGATQGALLGSLDQTHTSMGARKLRAWVCYPLCQLEAIQKRQEAIAELVQMDALRDRLRVELKAITDIERIATRISTARAVPRDLLGLGQALRQIPRVRAVVSECGAPLLAQLAERCDPLEKLAGLIESAIDPEAGLSIRDGGIIRAGYHAEVDRLRGLTQDGQSWLAEYQKRLIEETGVNTLKVGFNRVFGYFVEVSHIHSEKIPAGFVRKQTVKNAERYITDELKRYESEALTAEQRGKDLEEQLFNEVRREAAGHTLRLQQVAEAIATIDVLACLAHIARHRNYCRPEMDGGGELEIIEGRHPVLDVNLGSQFVPNDVALGAKDGSVAIITGPNMAGKSTYIRQTALLTLMAHMGSYIPAKSARIGLVDRIFTRVGASDELTRGQSTFMVEMIETANIVNNATARSLVILDEVGRGTSTYDGLALAWAITEHIATRIGCRTLFATHYHEITELADLLDPIKNYHVSVREWKDEVVFLHKIVEGRTDKSYGIHVARLAGIPREVIRRGSEILDELQSSFSREAHTQRLGGKLQQHKRPDGQMLLFDLTPPDPILDKLRAVDLNNLTPMQAINLLHEIKGELENR